MSTVSLSDFPLFILTQEMLQGNNPSPPPLLSCSTQSGSISVSATTVTELPTPLPSPDHPLSFSSNLGVFGTKLSVLCSFEENEEQVLDYPSFCVLLNSSTPNVETASWIDCVQEGVLNNRIRRSDTGINGSFLVFDEKSQPIAIVKPKEHELGAAHSVHRLSDALCSKIGILPGESAWTEYLAFSFASRHPDRFKVPPTFYCKMANSSFHPLESNIVARTGSVQKFVPGCRMFSQMPKSERVCIPPQAVHNLGIFDIALFNTDRNANNLVIDPDGRLWAVDNGCLLPRNAESSGQFCWLDLPQCHLPFDEDTKAFIESLSIKELEDIVKDAELRPEASLETFKDRMVTHFAGLHLLKMGVRSGLSLSEIAQFCLEENEYDRSIVKRWIGKWQNLSDPSLDSMILLIQETIDEYMQTREFFRSAYPDMSLSGITLMTIRDIKRRY
jgi:hypothetical protein